MIPSFPLKCALNGSVWGHFPSGNIKCILNDNEKKNLVKSWRFWMCAKTASTHFLSSDALYCPQVHFKTLLLPWSSRQLERNSANLPWYNWENYHLTLTPSQVPLTFQYLPLDATVENSGIQISLAEATILSTNSCLETLKNNIMERFCVSICCHNSRQTFGFQGILMLIFGLVALNLLVLLVQQCLCLCCFGLRDAVKWKLKHVI